VWHSKLCQQDYKKSKIKPFNIIFIQHSCSPLSVRRDVNAVFSNHSKRINMKTLWKLATCVAVVLLSFSMYSCGDDDEDSIGSVDELVGMWEVVEHSGYEIEDGERKEDNPSYYVGRRYELKSDMTFNSYSKGSSNPSETGKWELKNGSVHLIFYYPNDGGYDYEDPDIMKIVEISADKLVWEYHWKETGWELYEKETLKKIAQ
jgi:hypothetical protein